MYLQKLFLKKNKRVSIRDNMKQYRLSITLGDKSYVCNNINGDDIIIREYEQQARSK